jgi:uncharacterized protein (DUF1810 family)
MNEDYGLERYLLAQEPVFARVRAELAAGCKQSHWMWFIFPQLKGLGDSSMAQRYGISSLAEARAYLAHPVLGTRLRECTRLVNAVEDRSAAAIFGYPDYLKFRSCMTLFARVAAEDFTADAVFGQALERYFAGEADPLTRERLA